MRTGLLAVLIFSVVAPPARAQSNPFPTTPAAGQRVATDHVEVISHVSDGIVAPGVLFSVVLDIRPSEGIHLYAPGASGYKIIAFNLEANPLLVSRPTTYPDSEIYFFAPLNERVPVYQNPFRLSRSLAITTAPAHRAAVSRLKTMTVRGTLDYQACDDRTCFLPKSIPVSFSIKVRPLATERASTPSSR